jgi:hypothetical protein
MPDPRQLPGPDAVFLDHVGHFVPDMAAAHRDLARLGFVATPYTVHSHTADDGDGTPAPSGTANRCVMLREGYIEILAVTDASTPLGARTARQLARYAGLHIVAFSTDDPVARQGRLTFSGFRPQPLVHLSRPVQTADGKEADAAFTVLRVREEDMAEGRVQYLRHLTPEVVWQPRWLEHGNGIVGLRDVVICVERPDSAAARYCWFLDKGGVKQVGATAFRVAADRGGVVLCDRKGLDGIFPDAEVPSLPFIAGYALLSADLGQTTAFLAERGFDPEPVADGLIRLELPASIGGSVLIAADEARLPWAPARAA